MLLDEFHTETEGRFQVTRPQASRFAKEIADDFNPIHDPEAKRFCVPGDLLFALALSHYGLYQNMTVHFQGLVNDGVVLHFPQPTSDTVSICDERDKEYLRVDHQGDVTTDPDVIEALTQSYVRFSGHTFPGVLVPLMAEHKVMINPDRPLIIYDSMSISLDRLDITNPGMELDQASLDVQGKRGNVSLKFLLKSGDDIVGHGEKRMLMSGLRPYEAEVMDAIVATYDKRKQNYIGSKNHVSAD